MQAVVQTQTHSSCCLFKLTKILEKMLQNIQEILMRHHKCAKISKYLMRQWRNTHTITKISLERYSQGRDSDQDS